MNVDISHQIQLEIGIINFVTKYGTVDVPQILTTARSQSYINGVSDSLIVQTIHKMIGFGQLAYTGDRRLKLGPHYTQNGNRP